MRTRLAMADSIGHLGQVREAVVVGYFDRELKVSILPTEFFGSGHD